MIRKAIDRLDVALDDGLTKSIFDHVRNFVMCAFLLAIGTAEFNTHSNLAIGIAGSQYSGIGVIVIAGLLFALNLYDGIRKLSRLKHHRLLTVVFITVYAIVSLRLVEIVWHIRAAG